MWDTQTHLLCDSDSIIDDFGWAILALKDYISSFWSKSNPNEICKLIDPILRKKTRSGSGWQVKRGEKKWQEINSSSRGRCLKSDDVRQLTWSFLIAEPSLLKWSSFAAFTVKRHFLWGLIFICRGRETTGGERRRVWLVAKAAGAGLLRRHVPNGDAILSRYLLQGKNLRVLLLR